MSPIFPRTCGALALEIFCIVPKTKRKKVEAEFWSTGKKIELSSGRSAKSWGEGPVIWLLHGWASKGSTFYKFIPIFTNAGFKVIAWDGPAHGDSAGRKVNLVSYTKAAAEDIKELNQTIHTVIGHSFGGASLAILHKYINLKANIVIIGAPTEVPIIFDNFKRIAKISDQAYQSLINRAEKLVGFTISSISLIKNDLSKTNSVMIIHDKDDKEVPFKRFTKLKSIWAGGEFVSTNGLGHNRILKTPDIAKTIVKFIT